MYTPLTSCLNPNYCKTNPNHCIISWCGYFKKKKKKGEGTHTLYINFTFPKTRDGAWQKRKEGAQFPGWAESDQFDSILITSPLYIYTVHSLSSLLNMLPCNFSFNGFAHQLLLNWKHLASKSHFPNSILCCSAPCDIWLTFLPPFLLNALTSCLVNLLITS